MKGSLRKKNYEHAPPKASSPLLGLSAKKEHEPRSKVCPFLLGSEEYAFEATDMPEVFHTVPVTEVPSTPAFIKGIIPFRGEILAVIDLKKRFGMASAAKNQAAGHSKMLIAGDGGLRAAFLVDAVTSVCEAGPGPMEASDEKEIFVKGLLKLPGRVIRLLSLEKLLNVNIGTPASDNKKN